MKSLWQPLPPLKQILKILWTGLLDPQLSFFGIHIRRSDKLTLHEATDIPISKFAAKIRELCSKQRKACLKNVYVMYDEELAFQQLVALLGESFQVRRKSSAKASQITHFYLKSVRIIYELHPIEAFHYESDTIDLSVPRVYFQKCHN